MDLDDWVQELRVISGDGDDREAAKAFLTSALADPPAARLLFGCNERAELASLYRSSTLTVARLTWAPGMSVPAHDHLMWAVIGIISGTEVNDFFRAEPRLEHLRTRTLNESDVVTLGDRVIHAVRNPLDHFTSAVHIYGGDFFGVTRHEWSSPTRRVNSNASVMAQRFQAANDELARVNKP
jgi:hypothetical protein